MAGPAFIGLVTDGAAEGEAAGLLAQLRAAGEVPNHARLLLRHPRVLRAWRGLLESIRDEMDLRRFELVTLAAARALGSSYCMLAHGTVMLDKGFYDEEALRGIAADHRAAGLDEVDVAVMDLATTIARDAGSVTQADVDRLLALGLSEDDVLDVALATAARCFFSTLLDAMGVLPDASYAGLEPGLRDALVVGRPISES